MEFVTPIKSESKRSKGPFISSKEKSKPLFFQPKLTIGPVDDSYEREADAVADQVMRMSDHDARKIQPEISPLSVQRKCAECEEEENQLQKKDNGPGYAEKEAPSVVNDVLTSSGKSLEPDTKSFMENRFGKDFSNVKIHTDSIAAKSAQSINALAYTTGNNIIFNQGQYSPGTEKGQRLLAHELTHVVQQSESIRRKEKNPCFDEKRDFKNLSGCPEGSKDVGRQPQDVSNKKDAKANTIIKSAKNSQTPLSGRAIQLVNDIICTYMPSQAAHVRKIFYYPKQTGLEVLSVGSGSGTKADICVGDYFVEKIDSFARRVMQVAHELQHIKQWRSGMAGGHKSHEREFLAYYNEGLDDEFIGTGRMNDGTRRELIDGALGHFNCFDETLKKKYEDKHKDLLKRRETVNKNKPKDIPKECRGD